MTAITAPAAVTVIRSSAVRPAALRAIAALGTAGRYLNSLLEGASTEPSRTVNRSLDIYRAGR
jgi:hypothetical protein